MGRRNINTTKSGKYMNPTDQARKEARKRELKKNRKQRQMVRAAVLKGKDPSQILIELEKMDILEYSVEGQSSLSDKVVSEKRKKLRETLDRVMKLYEKENPEYWVELRRMEAEYDKKRKVRCEYYEAVRHAQAVTVDEIPLPNLDMPAMPEGLNPDPSAIPNPPDVIHPQSILKKINPPQVFEVKEGPGCPPCPPPDLDDDDDDESMETDERPRTIRFADSDETEEKDTRATIKNTKGLTSLQTKLLQISGQDIDDFMRESEVLFIEKEKEKQADLKARLSKLNDEPNLKEPPPTISSSRTGAPETSSASSIPITGSNDSLGKNSLAPPGVAPSGSLPAVPPPMMMRPPPRPTIPLHPGVRMPPVPPPQGMFKRLPNTRMPPPMPMRPPVRPSGAHIPPSHSVSGPPPGHNPNVLTAAPQLITRPKDDDKSGATIEAKAQIRNLSADVTRFLPTALRVKREDKKKTSKYTLDSKEIPSARPDADRRPTKDDAYSQFMKEMQDLL